MTNNDQDIKDFYTKNLKSIEEIDNGIDYLNNLKDIDKIEYSEFDKLFLKLFGVGNKIAKPIKKHYFEKLYIYRVRGVDEKGLDNLKEIKTFMGPPVDADVGFGRANWKKRNVFYGCPNIYTALLEKKSGSIVNKEYYVAEWVIDISKISLDSIVISSILINDLPEDNPWNKVFDGFKKSFLEMKTRVGEENSKSFEHLFKTINNLFISVKPDKYPISGYIADQILFKEFPILLYPTRIRDLLDCNLAINPFFVNDYMKLKKVVRIKITDDEKMLYTPIWYSFNNNGILEWYDIKNHNNRLSLYSINKIKCLNNGKVIDKFTPSEIEFLHFGTKIDIRLFIENIFKDGKEVIITANDIFNMEDQPPIIFGHYNEITFKGLDIIHKGVKYSNLSLNITVYQKFPRLNL